MRPVISKLTLLDRDALLCGNTNFPLTPLQILTTTDCNDFIEKRLSCRLTALFRVLINHKIPGIIVLDETHYLRISFQKVWTAFGQGLIITLIN